MVLVLALQSPTMTGTMQPRLRRLCKNSGSSPEQSHRLTFIERCQQSACCPPLNAETLYLHLHVCQFGIVVTWPAGACIISL